MQETLTTNMRKYILKQSATLTFTSRQPTRLKLVKQKQYQDHDYNEPSQLIEVGKVSPFVTVAKCTLIVIEAKANVGGQTETDFLRASRPTQWQCPDHT